MTLYKELEHRGYSTKIWTARYPKNNTDISNYGERLADIIKSDIEEHGIDTLSWLSTDPKRFTDEDLLSREISYGKAGFALQFQLNPNLSDIEKYPLKLKNLIVSELDSNKSPLLWDWLPDPNKVVKDLPLIGIKGDNYFYPKSSSTESHDYQKKILVVDPSGRSKDQTAYVVLYFLNGYIYLMETGGFFDGYSTETLEQLSEIALKHKVHEVITESNFGDGMFTKLLQPVLNKKHQCSISEVRNNKQKETRICDTLEPVLGRHKLIVSPDTIRNDYETAKDKEGKQSLKHSLFYQLTRITREKGCLSTDDKIDVLAMGVSHFTEMMNIDSQKQKDAITEQWLEDWFDRSLVNSHRTLSVNDVTIRWDDDDFGMGNFLDIR